MESIRDRAYAIELGLACHVAINELLGIIQTKGSLSQLPTKTTTLEIFKNSFDYLCGNHSYNIEDLLFQRVQQYDLLREELNEKDFDLKKIAPYARKYISLLETALDPTTTKIQRLKSSKKLISFLLNLAKKCIFSLPHYI